jgi:acyl-coenzyme A thioesterase PaaI-like protein
MASSSIVPLILEFIKGGNMQAASKPGFGHALRLSYNLISKERLTWEDKTLTYRYTFTEHVSTGAFMAIMDELTTNACFGVGQPSAPGVSLQMQMELTKVPLDLLKEVDIVSTVVKLGRTVSYVRSDFINPVNQQLVAFGSHVKYMPTGNFFMDTIFNNRWAFDLYARMALASPPDQYEEKDLLKGVIGPCLEYQGVGSATFTMNLEHVNPFGGLHVSCLSYKSMPNLRATNS